MTTRNFAGGGRRHVLAIFALVFLFSFAPVQAQAADGFFESLWCDITGFFGFVCETEIQVVETKVSTTIPPPPEESKNYRITNSPNGTPIYTTVVEEHNTYITNPTTIIRQSSGGGGGSSEGVSLELFHKQVDRIYDSMGNAADGVREDMEEAFAGFAESFSTALLAVSGNASIGGDLDVVGTLTAGSLSVSSVSSGGAVEAPYFTATSTSQASTFPYASTTAISSTYASSTNAFFGNLSVGNLTGFLKATAGAISTATIDLVNDVGASILAVANGGTGWANLQANTILLGNGTGRIGTTTAGTNGQVLALVGGVPTWTATTTLATISGTLGTANGGTATTTWINGGAVFYDSALGTLSQGATQAAFFFDKTNSRLGIGTISPTTPLHIVNASSLQARFAFDVNNYTDVSYNGFNTVGGAQAFKISGSEKMRVDSTGNVGIGTTSPYSMLSVAGQIVGQNFIATSTTATSSIASILAIGSPNTTLVPRSLIVRDYTVTNQPVARFEYTNGIGAIEIIGNASSQTQVNFGDTTDLDAGRIVYTSTAAAVPNTLAFYTGNSERVRINSAGMGIGTTTPEVKLHLLANSGEGNPSVSNGEVFRIQRNSASNAVVGMFIVGGTQADVNLYMGDANGHNSGGRITYNNLSDYLQFATAGSERMRVDSTGLGIGTTTLSARLSLTQSANTAAGGFWIAETGNTDYRSMFMNTSGVLSFNGGDTAGTLNTATLNAAGEWTNASDIAYKENIKNLSSGLDALMELQPRSYDIKNTNDHRIGFIAQEVELVIPEVVGGVNGSKGISYGNLVAVVVKAIQELAEKVSGFAESFTTKRLCLEDVCITKSQLQDILDEAGEDSAPVPPPNVEEPDDTPPDEVSEPDTEPPAETSTEEPTPEPEPEPAPESAPETP